jgi:hypothetical protein
MTRVGYTRQVRAMAYLGFVLAPSSAVVPLSLEPSSKKSRFREDGVTCKRGGVGFDTSAFLSSAFPLSGDSSFYATSTSPLLPLPPPLPPPCPRVPLHHLVRSVDLHLAISTPSVPLLCPPRPRFTALVHPFCEPASTMRSSGCDPLRQQGLDDPEYLCCCLLFSL